MLPFAKFFIKVRFCRVDLFKNVFAQSPINFVEDLQVSV